MNEHSRPPSAPDLADGGTVHGCLQGHEWIKDWLSCDPSTGVMTWKKTTGKARSGRTAGTLGARGYLYVRLKERTMLSHRLIWWFEHGEWPTLNIDHINGNRTDNRVGNLRLASALVNAQNLRAAHCDSKTGVLGVSFSRGGKYVAQIMNRGKKYVLGTFSTSEEAHAAYVQAKRRLHEGCTI